MTRPLADSYGRVAPDLRVSLTDRCNLRCTYCMPAEGLEWLPDESVLTDDEIVRLIDIGVRLLGIREVRFTGGEPLVRRGLVDIVAGTRAVAPDIEISMTTNALGLARTAAGPQGGRAGPRQRQPRQRPAGDVPRRSPAATGCTTSSTGLAAAKEAGLGPIKINAVLLRGHNDDQAAELLRWCLEHGYDLRFIEQMPLDAQHGWSRAEMVTAEEIFDQPRGGVRAHARPSSRGGARRPSCSSSTAGRRRSASSPR